MRTLRLLSFFSLLLFVFNSCQKEYSLEGGNVNTLAGTWEFRDSNSLYRGNMDTAYLETSGTTKSLFLEGRSLDGKEDFNMILHTTDPAFTTGSYQASNAEVSFEYTKNGRIIYEAGQLTGEFIVTISAISGNAVTGTFTGFATDSLGRTKTITAGKFNTRYSGGGTSGGSAEGTLGATAGACTPTVLSGTYMQGTATNASNTAQVKVNITKTGTYTISTDTVNGVSFRKTGTFNNLGADSVVLVASGTPTATGPFTYKVKFGTSTCTFQVTYAAAAPPSSGTLGGSPGACTPATPAGNYVQGTALTSSNTVTIVANVTTAGSYSISTNTVNGVTFSGSGVFTGTGNQNVVLTGSGTPAASGAQTFTVTYGTSTCTFSITFVPGTTPPTGDYFPMTANSFWIYQQVAGTAFPDSFKTVATSRTTAFGGNTYTQFESSDLTVSGDPDTLYYRKTTGNVFELADVTDMFPFDNSQLSEFNILRDNVPAGTTWNSQTYNNTASGIPISGYIKYTVLEKTAATVGTYNFTDVIKLRAETFVSLSPGAPMLTVDYWYARNVGLVKIIVSSSFGVAGTADIKRYQIF
jgi:hypothetical protein